MWQKSDGIPTTAWTGFHRIWTLVAFRKLSAVIYCVGIYVCVSLFGYAYNFEHYKLKTAESKASWSVRCWCATDNFVSRCSYLWLSYWREFFFLCLWKKTSWWPSTKYLFLSSAMLSSHPEGSLWTAASPIMNPPGLLHVHVWYLILRRYLIPSTLPCAHLRM